ncbi:DoxX family protein [Flavobacterium sp.]|uniref:DoxX family protein n=1 Tax=Flavobacterium sp. TaxID=239 RepID=UPI00326790F5
MKEEVDKTNLHLGYPVYFLTIIGVWKLLRSIVLLLPKLGLLKEWAYAFFLMTGALFSYFAVGHKTMEYFGTTLLLLLIFLSWHFRLTDKKVS